jgi:hypothetical protein
MSVDPPGVDQRHGTERMPIRHAFGLFLRPGDAALDADPRARIAPAKG